MIEMLITITIMTLALSLGIPSYRTWVQNTQIRNAAESIDNGIQRARAEAVKRNVNIEFVLGANYPWKIQVQGNTLKCPGEPGFDPSVDKVGDSLLQCSINKDFKNATVGVTPSLATTITFSSLGTVVPNVPASATLSQINLNTSVTDSSVDLKELRKLEVTIGAGGNTRVCDPNFAATSTDPRKC